MDKKAQTELTIGLIGVGLVVCAALFFIVGIPMMKPWWAEQSGKAEFAQADQNRKIAVLEAQAKMESAELLANAEIARAKGVAEANKIIGESLQGNEAYLRYLWIQSLENNNQDVIYVPTEAGLPILEAGRLR